jgi:hypothetical protein
MLRLTLVTLCALACAVPAAAEEPQPRLPLVILDRIGRLPGELVGAKKADGEMADAIFLAALARLPTDPEKEAAAKHFAGAKDRKAAGVDLAWALVNTKEFLKLHGLDKSTAETLKALNKLTAEWGKDEKKPEK